MMYGAQAFPTMMPHSEHSFSSSLLHKKNDVTEFSLNRGRWKTALLVFLGAVLFALSFPTIFFSKGLPWCAFFALLPVSLASVRHASSRKIPSLCGESFLWGCMYGLTSYALFNMWLYPFHPLAFVFVPLIAGVYCGLLFMLFALTSVVFPTRWYLVHFLLWLCYEYLRTKGFFGYSFGIFGYTLAFVPSLIQSADIGGVWILSALVTFPSFLMAGIIHRFFQQNNTHVPRKRIFSLFLRPSILFPSVIYLVLFGANMVYGVVSSRPFKTYAENNASRVLKIGMVQHSVDPWKEGAQSHTHAFHSLTSISRTLIQREAPELVVWSETAFVPSISYHLANSTQSQSFFLVQRLMSFLSQYPQTEFIIGNAEILSDDSPRTKDNSPLRTYNAALFYKGGKRKSAYYKTKLVPISENFPSAPPFRGLRSFLEKNGSRFWDKGTQLVLFEGKNARYFVPICFEDGFGTLIAQAVEKGAEIIVNITNDAWSKMEVTAMQHLQHSVLRAVENRRSVVRATNAGMTTIITPNGRITDILPSFTKNFLVGKVHPYTDRHTFYTRVKDDFWGLIAFFVLFVCILIAGVRLLKAMP